MKFFYLVLIISVMWSAFSFAEFSDKPSVFESGVALSVEENYGDSFSPRLNSRLYFQNQLSDRTCLASFFESFQKAITDATGQIETWASQFVTATGMDKVKMIVKVQMPKEKNEIAYIFFSFKFIKDGKELSPYEWFDPRMYKDWGYHIQGGYFTMDDIKHLHNGSEISGTRLESDCSITSEIILARLDLFQNNVKKFEDKVQEVDSSDQGEMVGKMRKYGRITNPNTGAFETPKNPEVSLNRYNLPLFTEEGRPTKALLSLKELFSLCQPLKSTPFIQCPNFNDTVDLFKGENLESLLSVASDCKNVHIDSDLKLVHCLSPSHTRNWNYIITFQGVIISEKGGHIETIKELPEFYKVYYETGPRYPGLLEKIVKRDGTLVVDRCSEVEYDYGLGAFVCTFHDARGSFTHTKVVNASTSEVLSDDLKRH